MCICDLLEYKVMNNEGNRKFLGDSQGDFAKKVAAFIYCFSVSNCITHNWWKSWIRPTILRKNIY